MCFKCKTCGADLKRRTSSDITNSVRALYFICTNEVCLERYAGTEQLGHVVQPSLKKFSQMSLDLFMSGIPENKRAAVLQLINS